MDVYSILGLLGIIFIVISLLAFWGLVYRDIKKTSEVQLIHLHNIHPKREYLNECLNERLGTTDVIGTL